MPLFVVETISTFRHKYVIDCLSVEHALDTVTMNDAEPFSDMHLGEQIIAGKEITLEEFHRMNDALNTHGDGICFQPESGSPWMGEKMIHVVNYDTVTEE